MTALRQTIRRDHAELVLLLALALIVRLAGLNYESFSMDEVTELRIARLPTMDIVLRADGFPPLYHLLLKIWLLMWGTPMAARWLSALLGLVTIYATYRFAAAIADRRTGFAAGLLATLSPLHVWFAQESRAYSLALPLAALALWRFQRAMTTGASRDWLLYGCVACAAVWTHYFLGIVVALQGLWALPLLVRPGGGRRPALVTYGLLAVAVLPLLAILRIDLDYQSGTAEGNAGLGGLLYASYAFLLGFSSGPSLRELHGMGLPEAARTTLPWILALAACLLPLGIRWLRTTEPKPDGVGYLAVMTVGPVVVPLLLAALFDLKYKVPYVSWASIPLLILLGDAIAKGWARRPTQIASTAYLCLALLALGNRHLSERYRTEDTRALAGYLKAHSSPHTPVLVVAGYMAVPLSFYLGDEWSVRGIPGGEEGLRSIAEAASGSSGLPIWLAYTRPFHGDPTGDIRAHLTSAVMSRLTARFVGVELYRLGPSEHSETGS